MGQARVGGFLADLAEDTPRACTAPHLRLPLADAALALGLPLGVLLEALAALEEAGLLSRTADTEILLHLPRGA
ncbi:hypothetical protein [Kitasatospora sp. KL5]|uniref:hypothetical protein n=1 Tax=Kitasatospora sp. KL5 TaxID=3425125 RepID=UPI003D6E68A0